MKLLRGVAVSVLLAGPAYAQGMPNVNLVPEIQHKTPEEKAQDAIREKAYRESLRKIPDAKASNDPWGDVRSGDSSATPKAKTATTRQKKNGSAAE
ncbi:hypothetical protein [Rhodopseudomonas pseudopalustris]|uniref:DUF4148 domain-containing protein n=1 Tax=Rhodopseudomonas pseudopalustris TaxID=1513892 RepID=A0A1H8UX95_9BRAD|nr:hypothetical protein [Rhodopseudomonas pseudopalustris]MBB1090887.1 hypothetical protein [Rhodopseudomonas palustris]SEP07574.1 hypothetical protein SAMN05444123_107287 [Rhodopseudomonas pseudopalustris]